MLEPTTAQFGEERDRFVERLLTSVAGYFDVFGMYLGHRLGLYRALADGGPLTAAGLAERAHIHPRYAREWLEHQATVGVLRCENPDAGPEERRYALPAPHAEVLTDTESLNYLAPAMQLVGGVVRPLPDLLEAYRTGGGVPYAAYGEDLWRGQGEMNRNMFLQALPGEWIPAMPDVLARLRRDPPARVADVGCGVGWSSIGVAKVYPKARVDGLDLDEASIEEARRNAEAAGVAERVSFQVRDASDPGLAGRYDLVMALECIHDMSRPVEALRAMRDLATDDGAVLVVDERVADRFGADRDRDLEWFFYGCSILHCLPAGMAEQPSAATGTVMRRPTLERYAREAGFSRVEVLPVDHLLFRMYRLEP